MPTFKDFEDHLAAVQAAKLDAEKKKAAKTAAIRQKKTAKEQRQARAYDLWIASKVGEIENVRNSPFPGLLQNMQELLQKDIDIRNNRKVEEFVQIFYHPNNSMKDWYGLQRREYYPVGMSIVWGWKSRWGSRDKESHEQWINILALPNSFIKVDGGLLGKTVLSFDEWNNNKDICKKALEKAWTNPHTKSMYESTPRRSYRYYSDGFHGGAGGSGS